MAREVSVAQQGLEAQLAEEEDDETIARLDRMFGAMERGITEAWGDRDRSYAGPVWSALLGAKRTWVEQLGPAADTAVPVPESQETLRCALAGLWEVLREQGPRLSMSKALFLLKSTEDVKREFEYCARREQEKADDPKNLFCAVAFGVFVVGLVFAMFWDILQCSCLWR